MKKIFLTIFVFTLLIGCNKSEESTKAQETQKPQKNEMVAIMDQMMDEMHTKPTENIDTDFSKMMIAHHEGAVKMSELLLKKGKNPELKNLAQNIISAQKSEIDLMNKFKNSNDVSAKYKEFEEGLNQSMAVMMDKTIKIHNDIDKDYAEQMIPHHQSAVEMAKVYLKFGKQPELRKLCENIVKNQTAEIEFLKNWLTQFE